MKVFIFRFTAKELRIFIRFFTLVRLQVAKIFEYRDLCNKYVAKIRETFPATAQKISKRSSVISRKIKSARWAEIVRNKMAFHFDAAYALNALNNLTSDHELTFTTGEIRGLTAFDFADRVMVAAMFAEAGSGDHDVGRDNVRTLTIEVQNLIVDFHAQTLRGILSQYGIMRMPEETELRENYCAAPGTICIPISTLRPNN